MTENGIPIVAAGLAACLAVAGIVFAGTPVFPAAAEGDKALGRYLSNECVTCHQISGSSVGAIPSIIGLTTDYFITAIQHYRDKKRDNAVMQTIASRLSDEEIAALAAYFGSLKPAAMP